MILSEELAFWVEVLALALSTVLSGTAAYYAYKQYSKRPKLEFYLQNEEYDPISYDTQRGTADVYCWLANVGKVAAHNVHGWLVYGDDPGGIWPETDEDSGVIDSTDNAATVYLERLMPNPPQGAPTFFIDSPKLFCFPVTVWKAGRSYSSTALSAPRGHRQKEPWLYISLIQRLPSSGPKSL